MTKLRKLLKIISLPAYIIGIVGFFVQFAATLVYSTAFVLIADVFIPTGILRTVRAIAEPTSTMIKVFSGYASDLADSRRNFLLYGYGSVCLMKILFFIGVLDLKLFNTISRPIFYLTVHVIDRFINSFRDAPRDGLIIESIPDKKMLPMAFAVRKGIASVGSVAGGLVGFVIIKYKLLNVQQIYFLSLFPAIIGSLLIFCIKGKKNNEKKERNLKELFLFLFNNILPYGFLGFGFYDLGYLAILPIFIGIFQKKNYLFTFYVMIFSLIAFFLPIDLHTKSLLLSIIMLGWRCEIANKLLYIFPILTIIQNILLYKNYIIPEKFGLMGMSIVLCIVIKIFIAYFGQYRIDKNQINYTEICEVNQNRDYLIVKTGICSVLCNISLGLVSGVSSPLFHIPLFRIFYLTFESFLKSEPYKELRENFKEYKKVFISIFFGAILVSGKLNDIAFFERGICIGFDKINTILFFVLLYISITIFSFVWGKVKKPKLILWLLCLNLLVANLCMCFNHKGLYLLGLVVLGAYSGGIESSLVVTISSNLKNSKAKGTILGLFFTCIGFAGILSGIGMSRIINTYGIITGIKFSMIFPFMAQFLLFLF